MRGMYIYEGFAHLQGPCACKIKPRFDPERKKKEKERKRSVQMDIRREKKLVKNIN